MVKFYETVKHPNPQGTIVALHGFGQHAFDSWIDYLNFDYMSQLTRFGLKYRFNIVYPQAPQRCWYSLRSWTSVLRLASEINQYVLDKQFQNVTIAGFSDGSCMAQVCFATLPSLWNRAVFHSGTFVRPYFGAWPSTLPSNKIISIAVGNSDFLPPWGIGNIGHAEALRKFYGVTDNDVRYYLVNGLGHSWAPSFNERFFLCG